ncbi:S-layer homology domain-containing protein [Oscillatoria sp. FACHB-1407]|uniref:S-layer homology domain-containing protein n=1 Tax=Oscillatoria sp. FACHB-1407 TaxID=2692847 RepID=UPI00168477C8|nr:S-layer homology domain-containing protein [Oscillatoria sp. FACHB-1407]MBD2461622.1 S-layer homology domain-containing protein [Oscillatoria sp. FACHB-1407]
MRTARGNPRQSTRLFSDIENHWAKECIVELAQRDLVKGDQNGQFRPDAPIKRGEFAVLMYWVFPRALPVREAQAFVDVPGLHWASNAVKWVYERGLFSGYNDRTFRPDNALSRLEALMVLVKGLNYALPLFPNRILEAYFDDAEKVPGFAQGAIASATLAGLVVSYPDVRQLRPHQSVTRAEIAAMLCQTFRQPDSVPRQYVTWSAGLETISETDAVPFGLLRGNGQLVKQIQTRLSALRLYPAAAITGKYTPATEAALIDFCRILELPNRNTQNLDITLARILLTLEPVCFILEQARNRDRIFAEYLQQEKGFSAAALAFLDKGIEGSPYAAEVKHYPIYLLRQKQEPQAVSVVHSQTGRRAPSEVNSDVPALSEPQSSAQLQPFPNRGEMPRINSQGLAFLHDDIQQACVCLGKLENGQLTAHWLGKNALANVELWSATKIIPLLNVVSKVNSSIAEADIDNGVIRPRRSSRGFSFYDLAVEIVNYKSSIGSSNSLAAMFKQFETPQNLENWLKAITGNTQLEFRGRYGEGNFIQAPELWDQHLRRVLLRASGGSHRGDNSISTYDMTRLVTMLAWHPYLSIDAQLPGAQWHSLESIIRAMGVDSARYLDVAIARLGLAEVIASPVIISKLGFGRSGIRHRTELVYTAYVQFWDQHRCGSSTGVSPPLRSLGMTLIGAKKLGNGDREATELDARMAAEVTEIVRRLVTDELLLS